jgi:hypothetical protein
MHLGVLSSSLCIASGLFWQLTHLLVLDLGGNDLTVF